jgi:hemoglobin
MRHAPFRVGIAERDAWLSHMRVAVDSLGLPAEREAVLWDYFENAAQFMINTPS